MLPLFAAIAADADLPIRHCHFSLMLRDYAIIFILPLPR